MWTAARRGVRAATAAALAILLLPAASAIADGCETPAGLLPFGIHELVVDGPSARISLYGVDCRSPGWEDCFKQGFSAPVGAELVVDWGDGESAEPASSTCSTTRRWPAQDLSHTYDRPGTYRVRVLLDGEQLSAFGEWDAVISEAPPTAEIEIVPPPDAPPPQPSPTAAAQTSPAPGAAPTPATAITALTRPTLPAFLVLRSPRAQSPAGRQITRYEWDVNGDGAADAGGRAPSHAVVLTRAGAVAPGVRVQDDAGRWSDWARITIDPLPVRVAALGDSVAAGHGLDNLALPDTPFDRPCRRAPRYNYSGQATTILRAADFPIAQGLPRLLACSGATVTPTPLDPPDEDLPRQVATFAGPRSSTEQVITVTGLANDVVWGFRFIGAIAMGRAIDDPAANGRTRGDAFAERIAGEVLPTLRQRLPEARASLADQLVALARDGERLASGRTILVTSYYGERGVEVPPSIVGPARTACLLALGPRLCGTSSDALQSRDAAVKSVLRRMNTAVAEAVTDARRRIDAAGIDAVDIRMVDVTRLFSMTPETVFMDIERPFVNTNCQRYADELSSLLTAARRAERLDLGGAGQAVKRAQHAFSESIYCAGLGHPTVQGQHAIGEEVAAAVRAWYERRAERLRRQADDFNSAAARLASAQASETSAASKPAPAVRVSSGGAFTATCGPSPAASCRVVVTTVTARIVGLRSRAARNAGAGRRTIVIARGSGRGNTARVRLTKRGRSLLRTSGRRGLTANVVGRPAVPGERPAAVTTSIRLTAGAS